MSDIKYGNNISIVLLTY